MRFLYGTGNPAKINFMKKRLHEIKIELIGLNDIKDIKNMGLNVPELGRTPIENARQKAEYYYNALGIPVFSCDSGLYIDGLPDELQPGVHIRRINGKYLNDEEMLLYYSELAKTYGDLTARYKNGICLIIDKEHKYEKMDESLASEPFIITSKPHANRRPGFPLDSLSVDKETGKYYYDLEGGKLEKVAVEDGFLTFFKKVVQDVKVYEEIEVSFLEDIEDRKLEFAVMFAKSQGKYVFCKHRKRSTLEMPGGKREAGEDILTTAKRELYEETGAIEFSLEKLGVYSVLRKNSLTGDVSESFGMFYYADIYRFEGELHSEIEEVIVTDTLPDNWTYPLIQPKLFERAKAFLL